MGKRDLERERQIELAAIWGAETDGNNWFPRRRGVQGKRLSGASCLPSGAVVDDASDVLSDLASDIVSDDRKRHKIESKKKVARNKGESNAYRLHCFVGPGTERNDVRTVFEAYEPKVELRTSQQGNLLNKTHFAVLTFRNKAMALHAVKMLDGTNQYDRLGVRKLKLGLMLSRKEHSRIRQKLRKQIREDRERQLVEEVNQEAAFVKRFMESYTPSTK